MGDGLNFVYVPGGIWKMVGVIGRRETGNSAKIGQSSNGRWEDSDPKETIQPRKSVDITLP